MQPERGQAISEAVARNVHEQRNRRGWSLDVLARRSGVSKGMLVQIEHGQSNPSLGTLVRLSESFGITIAQLIEGELQREVRVVRAGQGVTLWRDGGGSEGVLLLGFDRREHIELWRWELAPGAEHRSEAHLTGTQEMIHVSQGMLAVDVAGAIQRLRAGDAVLFPGDRDHAYRNEGPSRSRFEMVVVMPAVTEGS
jgi:transcriptional regulator with XRE-family HTH domain